MIVVRMCVVAAVAVAVSVSSVHAQVGLPTPRPGLPNAAAAKEAVKCSKAITKAAIAFASAKLNLLKKCTDTVGTCLQLKPADLDGCIGKAKGTCTKLQEKIAGAKAKLTAEVDKKCINVAPSELLGDTGLGFELAGFAATCAEVGVEAPTDRTSVATCIARSHECRVEQMLSVQNPLSSYLLGLVDIPLASSSCPDKQSTWPIRVLEDALRSCYRPLTDPTGPYSAFNNWLHGSVRGGDANKGARLDDASEANAVQRFEVTPASRVVAEQWRAAYDAIERCNAVLRLLDQTTDPTITPARALRVRGEARFMRAFYYFDLRRLFGAVPFIDETMTPAVAAAVANDVDIYPQIEADFQFAFDNLAETLPGGWGANKWAAGAFLAKVKMTQGNLMAAKPLFDVIIANGQTAAGSKYALEPVYRSSVTGLVSPGLGPNQFGSRSGEIVFGALAVPPPEVERDSIPFGCCGFFQPSFDLVDAFRTDANGLPTVGVVANDFGLLSSDPFTPDAGLLDPRVDDSVGRRGIPYVDWGIHPGADWILDQGYGGPFLPRKYVVAQSILVENVAPIRGLTSRSQVLLRFADILLMQAEAEVEIGSLENARSLVNQVRARAANPAGWTKTGDGSNAANYVIGLYNIPWVDKNLAREAVRIERRLELSGEGGRFYDLIRWGVAGQVINAYLQSEGMKLPQALGGASFTPGRDERYPIPQAEIDARAPGVLQQNPGY